MEKTEEKNNVYVRNNCGIRVKKCCASCGLKGIKATGMRFCTLTQEKVKATDVCDEWKIRDGLMNCGRRKGVVRDIDTKEVIIM